MRSVSAIIVTIIWGFLFGIVIGYIGNQLLGDAVGSYITMGIMGAVISLIGIFGIKSLSKNI